MIIPTNPVGEPDNIGIAPAVGVGFSVGMAKAMTGEYKGTQTFNDVVWLSYSLSRYYFGPDHPKTSAVIAGIPLGTIEELSHGISDREVRYRANGGVFLAHQDGGNESLRIVGKAWGENRFTFLNMLDFLFLYGSATVIDVLSKYKEGAGDYPFLNVDEELTTDPWAVVERATAKQGKEEQHMTFPVITRNRIYLSMYIETYSWRQSIDVNGKKSVTYTIFFRKYEPDNQYEFRTLLIPPEDEISELNEVLVYKKSSATRSDISLVKTAIEVFASYMVNLESVAGISKLAGQFTRNWFGVKTTEALKKKEKEIISGSFF